MSKKYSMSEFLNMGTAIGFSAAVGILIGALFGNLVLWLCAGAGVGVVIGAVIAMYKSGKRNGKN